MLSVNRTPDSLCLSRPGPQRRAWLSVGRMTAASATHRRTRSGHYHPLLGTNVEIRVDARGDSDSDALRLAGAAEAAAVEEMVRLQTVFSVFDPDSEVRRWSTGASDEVSAELLDCLAAAEYWWRVSGGAFHPASARLRALWLAGEAAGRLPEDDEIQTLVAGLAALPFTVRGDRVERTGDCSDVDLNAIAKGYIVDRAVAAASRLPAVVDVLVNAGGDLRHEGDRELKVGVENPADRGGRPAAVVDLAGGALATSGSVHRGFRIGGVWFGHVLDPRTGRPVTDRPSTTIRARDAMTADAVATIVNVLGWPAAGPLVENVPDIAVLGVDAHGTVLHGGGWSRRG